MFENLHRSKSAIQHSSSPSDYSPVSEYAPRLLPYQREARELTWQCRASLEPVSSPGPQPRHRRLTNTLLDSTPIDFKSATQTPYLEHAGRGKISKYTLSRWLSQDRLYAETYISFIASLIARVTLPYNFVEDKASSLRWRIINLLTSALTNIHREIEFFTSSAQKYDLKLDLPTDNHSEFGPNATTEQYLSLFRSFQLDPTQTLLEGLVVLWATEKCYLEAWTYAASFLSKEGKAEDDADGGAMRNEFIPNWTSEEFRGFVEEIADVTDELAIREGALRKVEVFKALWLHVLDIEKDFWPDI